MSPVFRENVGRRTLGSRSAMTSEIMAHGCSACQPVRAVNPVEVPLSLFCNFNSSVFRGRLSSINKHFGGCCAAESFKFASCRFDSSTSYFRGAISIVCRCCSFSSWRAFGDAVIPSGPVALYWTVSFLDSVTSVRGFSLSIWLARGEAVILVRGTARFVVTSFRVVTAGTATARGRSFNIWRTLGEAVMPSPLTAAARI